MPWTTVDVESHKKGLTDKQKKQWVAIANSVLSKCIKDGGSDATCAPSAIRQANGSVGTNEEFTIVRNQLAGYEAKQKTHNGTKHLVVPVTMIVEGILNGSHGPLLHLAEDFGHIPESWNGIPVVINHPEVNGVPVSANSPDIIEQYAVGNVYNTRLIGNRLRAEVWAEETKLNALSSETLMNINSGVEMEVSVGVYTDDEPVSGEWNGTKYNAIARNHRPDHLALLPGGIGACSLEDGCGIRANKNKKGGMNVNVEQDRITMLKSLNAEGFAVSPIVINDEGIREKLDFLRGLVNGLDNNEIHHYLEEAYDNYVIYEQYNREGEKLYKRSYSTNAETGEYEFAGDPVEVEKEVKYVPKTVRTNQFVRTKFINNLKKKTMSDEKCTPCIEKKVNALIANKATKWTDADRDYLQTLEESILDRMIPEEVAPVEKIVEKEVVVNQVKPEDQAALDFGKRLLAKKKADMIAGIQKNTEADTWTADELNAMAEPMLEKLYKSTTKEEPQVDYSLNGNVKVSTNREPEVAPMLPNV